MATDVTTEVTGTVYRLLVKVGDVVAADQTLAVLECMKMEIPVAAPANGTVISVRVAEGDAVDDGDVVATLG
ncbi:MAG TPA: biotin/lipoyl-binding carrier protein [Trebonia sp.]